MFQLERFIFLLDKQRKKMGIKMGLHIRFHAEHQNTLVQVDLPETFLSLVLFRYGLCLLLSVLAFN